MVVHTRKFFTPFRIFIIVFVMLDILAVTYYLKSNNLYGFRSFVKFKIPGCVEPIMPFLSSFNGTTSLEFKEYSSEKGYSIWLPIKWEEEKDWLTFDKSFKSEDIEYNLGSINQTWLSKGVHVAAKRVDSTYDFEGVYILDYLGNFQKRFQNIKCDFYLINGRKAVERIEKDKNIRLFFIEADRDVIIIEVQYGVDSSSVHEIINSIVGSLKIGDPVETKNKESVLPYSGSPSHQVPYKNLKFTEVDVYIDKPYQFSFTSKDFHSDNLPVDGYTFVANKDDIIEIQARKAGTINGIDVDTEIYAYGPTVIKHESSFTFKVPATGRYFLVVKSTQSTGYGDYGLDFEILR